MCLIPQQQVGMRYVKSCLPGKLVRKSAPKIFIRGWSCRHLLPGMYQNSKLPKGKHLFSINHIVCLNNLGVASHFCQLGWWELSPNPRFQTQPKGQPFKQAFQRRAVRPALLTPSAQSQYRTSFSRA